MTGKEKCEYLKHLREQIAKDSGIEGFEFRGCDKTKVRCIGKKAFRKI